MDSNKTTLAVLAVAVFVATPLRAQTNDQVFRSWRWSVDQEPARVAGMGGAFVAVADESSAAAFNPAGLTQVQKTELAGGLVVRQRGTAASGIRDSLRAVTGIGFAGGAAAVSSRWRIGVYLLQPEDRRADFTGSLPDGTTASGFLDTQVTEVGGAVAWQARPGLALGARVTATHLKLEAEDLTSGPAASEVGEGAGETRVTGSFGLLVTVRRAIRAGLTLQPGASYRMVRTANADGRVIDSGSASDLRQPGLVAAGLSVQLSPKILVSGQLDYVRYSEIRRQLVIRSGSTTSADYGLVDALEPRLGLEFSLPLRRYSVQLRGGVHSQAAGFLSYRGASPVEASTFRGGTRHLVPALGASLVNRGGLRIDLGGRLGGEQRELLATAGLRF